jgi:hypothetical protein
LFDYSLDFDGRYQSASGPELRCVRVFPFRWFLILCWSTGYGPAKGMGCIMAFNGKDDSGVELKSEKIKRYSSFWLAITIGGLSVKMGTTFIKRV